MFQDHLIKAMKLWHAKNKIEREPGFHASSAGYCLKRIILETLYPKTKKPFNFETLNIFEIGNDSHDKMDAKLRLYSQETVKLLWIQPFRLFSMQDVFYKAFTDSELSKDKLPVPLGIFGTPDSVIIEAESKKLIIPDFKTSNARAFNYKAKGSRSITNEMQLGTYLPSIINQLKEFGIDIPMGEASIIYINKENNDLVTHEFDPTVAISKARSYWEKVAEAYMLTVANGGTSFPAAVPPEKWMCNYCSMFNNKTACLPIVDADTLLNGTERQKKLL